MSNLSKLGLYAKPVHSNAWLDYARALKPYDILLLDPDIQQVSDAFAVNPEGEVSIRVWEWDDGRTSQNEHGVYRQLRDDPIGAATQIADRYSSLFDQWDREAAHRGIPWPDRRKLIAHLWNEPDSNYILPSLNIATIRALELLSQRGIRADALSLSTGHPAILKDRRPDWSPLAETLEAIVRYDGYAVVHEYFNDLGIEDESTNPWHVGRHLWMPRLPGLKVKIGEFGLENLVNGRSADHQGWIGVMNDEQYLWSIEYMLGLVRDDVVSVRLYKTDFVDRKWRTFDTAPLHSRLATMGRRFLVVDQPEIVEPQVIVTAADGVNVRSGPSAFTSRLGGLSRGTSAKLIGRKQDNSWFRIQSGDLEGWVSGEFVTASLVERVPVLALPPEPQPVKAYLPPAQSLAFMAVESAMVGFTSSLMTIRFEVHLFEQHIAKDLFDRHFRFVPGDYSQQFWRPNESTAWENVHGPMALRHRVLSFARSLNDSGALFSTGMGLGQIMGFHYEKLGYRSPQEMFNSLGDGIYGPVAQVIAFVNFLSSNPALLTAIRNEDWYQAVTIYNGEGQQDLYIGVLEERLAAIRERMGG